MEGVVIDLLGAGALDEVTLLRGLEEAAEAAAEDSPDGVDLSGLPGLLWDMVEAGQLTADLPEGSGNGLTEPLIYRAVTHGC